LFYFQKAVVFIRKSKLCLFLSKQFCKKFIFGVSDNKYFCVRQQAYTKSALKHVDIGFCDKKDRLISTGVARNFDFGGGGKIENFW